MLTVGIDLAAEAKKTGACEIHWHGGRAVVTKLQLGCEDEPLIQLIEAADKAAIDAPFGWPDEFVQALVAHQRLEDWPGRVKDTKEFRLRLSYRETDRFVERKIGRRPLSVSTDKLGVTAMRCALLIDKLAAAGSPVDRTGGAKVVEVYPAAALVCWGLRAKGSYKAAKGREGLKQLARNVRTALPALAFARAEDEDLFARNDDAFDALISALIARAAALGLTEPPPEHHRDKAAREGWIHLPRSGSLGLLATPQT